MNHMNQTQRWIAYLHTIAMMRGAGIDLLKAHQLMAQQLRFQPWHRLLWSLCDALSSGESYHESLLNLRPSPIISLYVRVGEQTGQLETALHGLHRWLHRRYQFKTQCLQALTYPSMVLLFGLIFILSMIHWVLPAFIGMYQQLNAIVPSYMITVTELLTPLHVLACIMTLLVCISLLRHAWLKGGYPALQLERFLFSLPFLGKNLRLNMLAQSCELLAMAFHCGIPLPDVLSVLSQQAAYLHDRQAWAHVHTQIMQGTSFSQSMRTTQAFELAFIELVDIGEKTGKLDEQFQHISIYYTESLFENMQRFKEAIQPSMMLILGLILGGWVILLYMPIIQLGYLLG